VRVFNTVSTGLRALPLLFCAFTSASTSAFAAPDKIPRRQTVAFRLDTPDFVNRSIKIRFGKGTAARVSEVSSNASATVRPAAEVRVVRPSTCYEIRSGDTAARLAQRFTGNEFNRYANWFQIVDPVTGVFVAKSRYNIIQSGWHVCVATDMLRLRSLPGRQAAVLPGLPVLPATLIPVRAAVIDARMLWWGTPLLVLISGLLLAWSWKQIDERRARVDVMKRFGNRFISEFERPLSRSVARRPIKARLRYAPVRRKVEILLAPANGHTYPNLVDHRRNVEYDVDRVLHLLRHEPFIGGAPYAEGRWVVIPCRLETGR
jgi:hypothetical protein